MQKICKKKASQGNVSQKVIKVAKSRSKKWVVLMSHMGQMSKILIEKSGRKIFVKT
jgi:hypothetical protein